MKDGASEESKVEESWVQSIEGSEHGEGVRMEEREEGCDGDYDDELRRLVVPDVRTLPITPTSSVEANFDVYFAPGMRCNLISMFFTWSFHVPFLNDLADAGVLFSCFCLA